MSAISNTLLKRDAGFRPEKHNETWDALRNEISWVGGERYVASLRGYIADDVRPLRREVVDRVQLPDQAILESQKGSCFTFYLVRDAHCGGSPRSAVAPGVPVEIHHERG